jgi:hypothetical protein
MTSDSTLIFEGTRWQKARAVPAGSMLFEVTATGRGRKWSTNTTLGFWRTFSETPLDDGEAIAAFVQRYGDPHGMLDAGEPMHTGHWKNLSALLGVAARAWEPEDKHGVSHFSSDPQRNQLAQWHLRDEQAPLLKDAQPIFDPSGGTNVVLRASRLASFMALSAASAIERRIPMRRCQHCGHWLEMDRRDKRFCSSSCRSFHSQQ